MLATAYAQDLSLYSHRYRHISDYRHLPVMDRAEPSTHPGRFAAPAAFISRIEFPYFRDGDVEILASPSCVYRLHSGVLIRKSAWFAQDLQNMPPARPSSNARWARRPRVCYKRLVTDRDSIGRFVRMASISQTQHGTLLTGRQPISENEEEESTHHAMAMPSFNGCLAREASVADRHWEMLFGYLYDILPMSGQIDLADTIEDCTALITRANILFCLRHIFENLELAVIRHQPTL